MKNYITSLNRHMTMLCETIGPRPTGSEKNKEAVEYADNVLKENGLKVRKQEFNCIDWKNTAAELFIDGQNVSITASEYSLPCNITADFICIDTLALLNEADLSGKIAVLYGELCNEPLMPKNFEFYNPDEHKQIIAKLEEKNPAAIITVNPHHEDIIQDGDFNIPCASVDADFLDTFLNSDTRKADLQLNTERIPTKSHNVIATYGTEAFKICFSAHIDTKPATPGALDNASGVSALLTLAESFSGNEFPFQIEIVLLNGEDYYSTPGEIIFMGDLSPEYILAVNVDGIGLKNSATSISFYECPKEIEVKVTEYMGNCKDISQIEPWPMGDHMMFANCGIPTIAITANNIFDQLGTIIHSPADNMENIEINIINNVVNFLSGFLQEWKNNIKILTNSSEDEAERR